MRQLAKKLNASGEVLAVEQPKGYLWVFLTYCDSRATQGGITPIPIHQGTRVTL